MVIQPQLSRRELRALRKKEQRKKFGLGGGVLAGVIAIALIVTVIFGVHHAVTSNGGPKRTQTTVLFQLQGSNRTAEASMLLASDPAKKQGVEMMIQPRLISDVCGYGEQNFGDVLALPGGAAASRQALSTVLNGVTIDGSWILNESQLAKLVNTVGGLHIAVDTNVVRRTAGGGGVIEVPAGSNVHVNGTQAVEYATYATDVGQGAAAQLLRLQTVVDATIQALPKSVTGVESLLRSLGAGGQSTIGVGKLAHLLVGIAADDQSETGVYATDLPANTIEAGGSAPSYRADDSTNGVNLVVSKYLQNSVPENADAQHATVLLLNGTGLPGLVSTACPRLAAHGFTYAGSGNAPSFSNPRSQVQAFSQSTISQAQSLAHALGLPSSDVRLGTLNQSVARFIVILGRDYRP
jgi:anionic cell wall polymer biosynthesis LytR-Cps2A-Psr (LCP) family protein